MAYLDLTGLGYFKDELVSDTLSQSGRAADAKAAGEAIYDSLPTDTASGSIASFSDGAENVPVEALTVSLEPVQDLNGQSAPYPAGGGKQMIPLAVENIKALNTAGSWSGNAYTRNGVTFTITLNAVGAVSGIRANGTATGTVKFIFGEVAIKNGVEYVISGFDNLPSNTFGNINPALTGTSDQNLYANKTGTADADKTMVVSFYVTSGGSLSNKDLTPMICLSSASNPTVFAPYSNLCPITGHSTAQVWRSGVNVWDEEWEVGAYSYTTGEEATATDRIRTKNFIPVRPNASYYIKGNGESVKVLYYDVSYGFIETWSGNSWLSTNRAFTTPNNCYYIHFAMAAAYGTTYNNDISINYPSTDHDYHAHSIVNISIPLSQTVFGGTVDVVGGVVTVDRAMVELTGSDDWYSFSVGTASASAICNLPSAPYVPTAGSGFNGAVSSIGLENPRYWASARPNETPDNGNWSFAIGSGVVRVYSTDITAITSLASFKAAFTASQYCFTLATPIEIQLTDIPELVTLLGQNNIWSDSGDVSVTYRADIQKYIAKVISEALA